MNIVIFLHFSFKKHHIFLRSLKTITSKIKIPSIYPSLKIIGSDKYVKLGKKVQNLCES